MFTFLSLLLLCASAKSSNSGRRVSVELQEAKGIQYKLDLIERWGEYKKTYGKSYDESEESIYLATFIENLERIEEHNREYGLGRKLFELGLNHLADLPYAQYQQLNGYRHYQRLERDEWDNSSKWIPPYNVRIPESVDWRREKLVTAVKNQGNCGSCWAFSATGALEGQHARDTKKLISLSEQNLIDCSSAFGNNECAGGLMDHAFEYIKENHGINTEESYPYFANDSRCHFARKNRGAIVTGFVDLPVGDEDQLKIAVATQGPTSVAIDAGNYSFQLYKKGVYYEEYCSAENLNHGVLVVGYGTDPKEGDYWIVKNSWGKDWGEEGYIRMARNRNNHCGISTMVQNAAFSFSKQELSAPLCLKWSLNYTISVDKEQYDRGPLVAEFFGMRLIEF